uniref:RING-type domain-containing protein n=1 Tax=Macrostomum lignano TaxID=282301 RepID=A0A1I8GFH6_9PLAT
MDPELFTSQVKSFLLCRICRNVLRNPVLNKKCGHSFCFNCLSKTDNEGYNACPEDPDSVPDADCVVPNRSREDGLNELHLRCLYRYAFERIITSNSNSMDATESATQTVSIDSLLPCLSRPLRWDEAGCDAEVTLGELNNHLSSCEHRWVACKDCGATVRAHAMEHHSRAECSAQLRGDFGLDFSGGTSHTQPHGQSVFSDSIGDIHHRNGLDGDVGATDGAPVDTSTSAQTYLTRMSSQDASNKALTESYQGPTRDQLRTLLATQKRLEDATTSLSNRIGTLNEQIDARLKRVIERLAKLQEVQQRRNGPTNAGLVAAPVSLDGANSSRASSIRYGASHLAAAAAGKSNEMRVQEQQQQQPLQPRSGIRLVVMDPSSYSSSAASDSSSDSSSLQSGSSPQQQLAVSGNLANLQQQQQQQGPMETEWTLPFSLNCTGSFNGHSASIIHLAVDTTTSSSASRAANALYSFARNGEIRVWDTVGSRCFAQTVWTGDGPNDFITCATLTTIDSNLVSFHSPEFRDQQSLIVMANNRGSLARLSMAQTDCRPPKLLSSVSNAHSGCPVTALAAGCYANKWLLFTAGRTEVRVWRLPQLAPLQHVTNLERDIGAICLAPMSNGAGSSAADSSASRLVVACRNRICLFGRFGLPHCLAASKRHVIVGSAKKGIWVLDANLKSQVACLGPANMPPVRSLACTANGKWLLSGQLDGTMRVWDLRTWRSVQQSQWHRETIDCLQLAGNTAYSGSADATIKVYKYTNQKLAPICQQLHHAPFFG